MIYCLPDSCIEQYLDEDAPYGDLTTHLVGIDSIPGRITFSTRHDTTVCCTEEAARVFQMSGAEIRSVIPSGTRLQPGTDILVADGPAHALHRGWKVALNLLEYASGISSRTQRIIEKSRAVSRSVSVVTTRKSFPGTRKTAMKAIVAGGALPHRLGLSESILVFRQHTAFLGGLEQFLGSVAELKIKAQETKVIIEADTVEEALLVAKSGADIVQLDKVSPIELSAAVCAIRAANPAVLISAAGGINEDNAAEYAATGIDIIVLSSVYFGKPADIGVNMVPV